MNREQIVDAVATVEREFNEGATSSFGFSDDSLKIWYRKLAYLKGQAVANQMPTTRIEGLIERVMHPMSPDLIRQAMGTMGIVETTMEAFHPTSDKGAEVCRDCVNGTCQLPEHQADPDADEFQCERCFKVCDVDESNRIVGSGELICDQCQAADIDAETQEDIDATREEMEAKMAPLPKPPAKTTEERKQSINDLFGDLSL